MKQPSYDSSSFYDELLIYPGKIQNVISQPSNFVSVPSDWHVLITDVINSTSAVDNGLHQEVNLAAVGSIIAAYNVGRQYSWTFPTFFGGDGATLLIPPRLLDEIYFALKLHQESVEIDYGLNLRLGSVQVSKILEQRLELKITKCKPDRHRIIPLILGSGLNWAEEEVKSGRTEEKEILEQYNLNREGMDCKWKSIHPDKADRSFISLLIVVRQAAKESDFHQILSKIEEVYGANKNRGAMNARNADTEIIEDSLTRKERKQLEGKSLTEIFKSIPKLLFPNLFLKMTDEGQKFAEKITALTDDLMIDGRINAVIQGNNLQHKNLIAYLTELEKKGTIYYGYHRSDTATISCRVENLSGDFVHYVDGGGGGFTQAAKYLKPKLASKKTTPEQ